MKKEADKAQSLQEQLNMFKKSVSIFDLEESAYKGSSFLHIFWFVLFWKNSYKINILLTEFSRRLAL